MCYTYPPFLYHLPTAYKGFCYGLLGETLSLELNNIFSSTLHCPWDAFQIEYTLHNTCIWVFLLPISTQFHTIVDNGSLDSTVKTISNNLSHPMYRKTLSSEQACSLKVKCLPWEMSLAYNIVDAVGAIDMMVVLDSHVRKPHKSRQ